MNRINQTGCFLKVDLDVVYQIIAISVKPKYVLLCLNAVIKHLRRQLRVNQPEKQGVFGMKFDLGRGILKNPAGECGVNCGSVPLFRHW
jgi:hypothetical protein